MAAAQPISEIVFVGKCRDERVEERADRHSCLGCGVGSVPPRGCVWFRARIVHGILRCRTGLPDVVVLTIVQSACTMVDAHGRRRNDEAFRWHAAEGGEGRAWPFAAGGRAARWMLGGVCAQARGRPRANPITPRPRPARRGAPT